MITLGLKLIAITSVVLAVCCIGYIACCILEHIYSRQGSNY
jgi:hypothetical protein